MVRRVERVPVMEEEDRVTAEVRWKGGKGGLGALRRGTKRNWTRGEGVGDDGVVVLDEEFRSVCSLSAHKENVFQPWEIGFTVFRVSFFFFTFPLVDLWLFLSSPLFAACFWL